jgi:hypothetical protein
VPFYRPVRPDGQVRSGHAQLQPSMTFAPWIVDGAWASTFGPAFDVSSRGTRQSSRSAVRHPIDHSPGCKDPPDQGISSM